MQCPSCHAEIGNTATFCPLCGASTVAGGVAPVVAQASGLSETAAGVIAYITIIPAIIFLAMEPYNRSSFVRFHSWQSIFLGIAAIAISIVLVVIPIIGWILLPILDLGLLVLWIIVVVKANKGERYKLPFIGNFAEQQAN
jgi:uncharacterized membrane protein